MVLFQGWNGSGTIFFGMCNLRCVFCQNWDISQRKKGWQLDAAGIADLMLKLQDETHCHNVNFVTPEHVVPQVMEAVLEAVKRGFSLPIVYNTSSYDSMRSLELLEKVVDVYMPDFKFWTAETSARLCKARDYPEVTKEAVQEMYRQVGDLVFDSQVCIHKMFNIQSRFIVFATNPASSLIGAYENVPKTTFESDRILNFSDTFLHF